MHGHPRYGGRVGLVAALAIVSGSIVGLPEAADAQSTPPRAEAQQARIAVVNRDDVMIRSGAHDDYYPFGRLAKDRLVKVLGHKNRWARVPAVGEAFDSIYGYVRYRKDDTSRLRVAADGRSGTALKSIDILAPNLNTAARPSESWKVLAKVDPNRTIIIIETQEVDGEIVHKVPLPPEAVGWINTAHLRDATPTEARRWTEMPDQRPSSRRPVNARANTPEPVRSQPMGRAEQDLALTGPPAPQQPTVRERQPVTQQPVAANTPATTADAERAPEQAAQMTPITMPAPQTPQPRIVRPSHVPRSTAMVALEDLEHAYAKLRSGDLDTAEVSTLRELYLDLAQRNADNPSIERYAGTRADQLQIWSDQICN